MGTISRTILSILLCSSLLTVLPGCNEDVPGLQPTGLNSSFELPADTTFQQYIGHYRDIIEKSRLDLYSPDREKIIDANLPFEMRPQVNTLPTKGILLIHGLFDSPYQMKSLARYFKEKGFLVRAILLPGHGTVPGDQIGVELSDWQHAVEYGVNTLKKEVQTVYIGGFSTGGGLALLYTLEHPGEIDGLFLFSPCLKINTKFARLASPVSHFKKWLTTRKNLDYARYESFATNSGAQVYHLTRKIKSLIPDNGFTVPVFAALSSDDTTVNSNYTIDVFTEKFTSESSRMLIYTNAHFTDLFEDQRISVIDVSNPAKNIISSSHTAMTIPPKDDHYGENGDSRYCLHYSSRSESYKNCRTGNKISYGEISRANLSQGTLRRLSWNPKYNDMLERMDSFLENMDNN